MTEQKKKKSQDQWVGNGCQQVCGSKPYSSFVSHFLGRKYNGLGLNLGMKPGPKSIFDFRLRPKKMKLQTTNWLSQQDQHVLLYFHMFNQRLLCIS